MNNKIEGIPVDTAMSNNDLENLEGFIGIYKWSEENGKKGLMNYIIRMTESFEYVGLTQEGFLFNPITKEIRVVVDKNVGFQKGHVLENQQETAKEVIYFFGGVISYLIDPAACAVVYTQLEDSQIPVTATTNIRNIKPVIWTGPNLIISAKLSGGFNKRLNTIIVKGQQGGIDCFTAELKIATGK